MLGTQQLAQRWNTRGLHSHDEERRALAIEQLSPKSTPNAFKLVVDALPDHSPLVRVFAVKKLGELRDDRAIESLIALALSDNHIDVQHATVEALKCLSRSKCVARLVLELDQHDPAARLAAARLLWKLSDDSTDQVLKARVAIELGEWSSVAEIGSPSIGPLTAVLRDGTPRLRRNAAEAFVSLGTSEARDTLIEVMNDSACELSGRSVAAWALWQFRWSELPPDDYVRAAVRLGQWNAVRDMAAGALGPLSEALHDMDPQIRLKAVETLAGLGTMDAIALLCKAMVNHATDAAVRERIARELHSVQDAQATAALATALRDESWPVRVSSAKALQDRGWSDPDPATAARFCIVCERWSELEAMGSIAVEPLLEALHFPAVNRGAADTLVRLGEPGIGALIAAQADPSAHPVIRELIAITLARAGDQRALIPLKNMLKEPDSVIRSAAVLTLERLGWTPQTEPERAIVAIAHEEWDEVVKVGAAAVEPLHTLVKCGCARAEAVAAFERIVHKWSGRLPLERLRGLMELEDPSSAALPGVTEGQRISCAKLRQLARLELIRRGIVL